MVKLHPEENRWIRDYLRTGINTPGGMVDRDHKYKRFDAPWQDWAEPLKEYNAFPLLRGVGTGISELGKSFGWWGKEQRPFTDMPSSVPIGGGAELGLRKIWKDPERYTYEIEPDYVRGAPGAPGGPPLTGLEAYGLEGGPTIGGEQVDLYPRGVQGEARRLRELLYGQENIRPWRDQERDYLSTAGALREAIGAAYGINTRGRIGGMSTPEAKEKKEEAGLGGEREALDPMVRLQNELMERYQNYQMAQQQDRIRDILTGRYNTLSRLGAERSAAMGTPGLYQEAMTASEAARDTLANQAHSAYKPMQSMLERQYREQNDRLMGALDQLEHETQATIRSMGKQGVFENKEMA